MSFSMSGRTYHLLHQILHNESLLLCANIAHPHPAIFQFIVNNKHVPFKEAANRSSQVRKTLSNTICIPLSLCKGTIISTVI